MHATWQQIIIFNHCHSNLAFDIVIFTRPQSQQENNWVFFEKKKGIVLLVCLRFFFAVVCDFGIGFASLILELVGLGCARYHIVQTRNH